MYSLNGLGGGAKALLEVVLLPFFENWTSQPLSVSLLIDSKLVPIAGAYRTSVSWIRLFLEASSTVPMPAAGTILLSPIRTFIGFGYRRISRKAPLLLQIWSVAPRIKVPCFLEGLVLVLVLVLDIWDCGIASVD